MSAQPPGAPLQARTIGAVIAAHAAVRGDAVALAGCAGADVTFAQLSATVASFASALPAAGIGPNDRVALVVPGGVVGGELVIGLASNATLVPLNPMLTAREVLDACFAARVRAVVIAEGSELAARAALEDAGVCILEARPGPGGAVALRCPQARGMPAATARPARERDVALLLRSSGTTGEPKAVPVTHANLVAMAERMADERWFRLGAGDRACCLLPLYYAAGVKTSLIAPLLLGASVGFPPAGRSADLAEWVGRLQPTYLSVAPGLLDRMLERLRASPHRLECASLRFVMCAAAYLPEPVRAEAESRLGVRVVEFYGLTEAGVMASNPAPPGRIKPGTVGLPLPGELMVVDEGGREAPAGSMGEIWIRGPTLTPGHDTPGGTSPERHEGWLRTGDLGRIDDDGYLTIAGRVKEVINRGGEKILPYEIEKALLEHPAVAEAAAFGVPHPRLGEHPAAAVVLEPGETVGEEALKRFLATRLAAFKLPRRIRFTQELPRGATGKVLRSALSSAHAAAPLQYAEPNDLLEVELRDLWARLLGVPDVGVDDDFFELGGDSLLATTMLLEVEELTGLSYPESDLSVLTIRRMADALNAGLDAPRAPIVALGDGPGIPLFFCHGDYVTRGIYAHRLASRLAGKRPVFLLHHCPERLKDASIEEIAGVYAEEVLRAAPRSPVFVGGYCNGGLAAWHLAALLRARNVPVIELLLVETMSLNARDELRALAALLQRATALAPRRASAFLREKAMRAVWIKERGYADYTTLLYRAARRKIGQTLRRPTSAGTRADARAAARRSVLADLNELMSRYVPPPIDVPVTCFIAEDGCHADTDPSFWRPRAAAVREVRVPGTHYTAVVSERSSLAAALDEAMERAGVPARDSAA